MPAIGSRFGGGGGVGIGLDGGGTGSFSSRVEIDPRQLADFIRSPSGEAFRGMLRIGDQVIDVAKDLVGVRTGNLRDHIIKRVVNDGDGFAVEVGADVPYALIHHEGSEPHMIYGNPLLAFEWNGQSMVLPFVSHPGTRPNRFLTDALARVRF